MNPKVYLVEKEDEGVLKKRNSYAFKIDEDYLRIFKSKDTNVDKKQPTHVYPYLDLDIVEYPDDPEHYTLIINDEKKKEYFVEDEETKIEIISKIRFFKSQKESEFLSVDYKKMESIINVQKCNSVEEKFQVDLEYLIRQLIRDLEPAIEKIKKEVINGKYNKEYLTTIYRTLKVYQNEINKKVSEMSSFGFKMIEKCKELEKLKQDIKDGKFNKDDEEKEDEEKDLVGMAEPQKVEKRQEEKIDFQISYEKFTIEGDSRVAKKAFDKRTKLTDLPSFNRMEVEVKKDNSFKNNRILIFYSDPIYSGIEKRDSFPYQLVLSKEIMPVVLGFLSRRAKNKTPIKYYEPLTLMQRHCEKFYYSSLLRTASANASRNLFRKSMAYICAFIISEMNLYVNRFLFPLPSVKGDTFEYIDNEKKYIYFSECLSTENQLVGYHCESDLFAYYGDSRGEWCFNAGTNALEYEEKTERRLRFKEIENYLITYNFPIIQIKNVYNGKPYFTFRGKTSIKVQNFEIYGELEFDKGITSHKDQGGFTGKVWVDKGNDVGDMYIKGNWNEIFQVKNLKDEYSVFETLWQKKNEKYLKNKIGLVNSYDYYLPSFSYNLASRSDKLISVLPETDVRNRKDILYYIIGDLEKADKEKSEHLKKDSTVKYFNEEADYVGAIYKYNEEYWKLRGREGFVKDQKKEE